tara:strand:- start:31725 stop:32408 length:684 start_codon:yes stop_codon:yes gene_type:complete
VIAEDQTLIVQQRPLLSFRVRLLLGAGFLLLALFVVVLLSLPPKLKAGQVIDQYGVYRFPTGGQRVEIKKTAANNVQIIFHRRFVEFSLFSIPIYSRLAADQPISFEAERDWFVSVDRYQRLWIFHGRWDQEWGALRPMPSGGTVPYPAAVLMQGSWFLPKGKLATGGNVVSMTGEWAGVPSTFFERIPDKDQGVSTWGGIPPIPVSPPPFTKKQQTMIELKLGIAR